MELLNPTITVQNTDQSFWLVRMEHKVEDGQYIDIRLPVPRSGTGLPGIQRQLLTVAIERLTTMRDSLGT